MTDLEKICEFDTLGSFKTNYDGITLPNEILIIPYFITSKSEYPILRLNNFGILSDFGKSYNNRISIESYVEQCVRENSLKTINLNENYILSNSTILFFKSFNVYKQDYEITDTISPIIFVRMRIENTNKFFGIVEKFKENYFTISRSMENSSEISTRNIVYMNFNDLFYLCRGTTASVMIGDEEYEFDVRNGYPCNKKITKMYKIDHLSGNIPSDFFSSKVSNCPPEIKFYNQISSILEKIILFATNFGIPIISRDLTQLPFILTFSESEEEEKEEDEGNQRRNLYYERKIEKQNEALKKQQEDEKEEDKKSEKIIKLSESFFQI